MKTVTVSKGDEVVQGQPIGTVGSTGNSSGVHLHFAIAKSESSTGVLYDNNPNSSDFGIKDSGGSANNALWSTDKANLYDKNGVTYAKSISELFDYDIIGSQKLTFAVKESGENALAEFSKPYGNSKKMKSLTAGTNVVTSLAGINSFGNVWYKTANGYYIYDAILEYVGDASEIKSSEDVDMALIVKKHESQPMYENRVPFGIWIKPVEHQAGDIVYAVKKLVNSAGSTWYLLDSGKYMWSGVLEEVGADLQYTLTTEVLNSEGGTASANGIVFVKGQKVKLTATPEIGYKLNYWLSDNEGTFGDQYSANTTFTMPAADTTITAVFVPVDYSITISSTGSGSWSAPVLSQYGKTVEISATPGEGYYFAGWESSDIDIDENDKTKRTYQFTMPASDVRIKAYFLSTSADLSDWQIDTEIPAMYSRDDVEIQYKHTYQTVAEKSPGDGWVQGDVNRTYYQNTGSVEEFPYEQTTSDTYVYVGGYYYHWCGSNKDCNYQKTAGKYETYHGPNSLNDFDIVSSGTDTNNSKIKWYRLQWKSGKTYSGLAYCATSQSANWYRMYQYQRRTLVIEYNWSKETDWIDTLDSTATSYTMRWRVINQKNIVSPDLILPAYLAVIESNAFTGLPVVQTVYVPETVIDIADDAFDQGIVIITPSGSFAERWAQEHGYAVLNQTMESSAEASTPSPFPSAMPTPAPTGD